MTGVPRSMVGPMRKRDTGDVLASCAAIAADGAAVFGGFLLATWIRFDSGWIPLFHDRPPSHLYYLYGWGAATTMLLFLFIFQLLELYVRPQTGRFENKLPRLLRGTLLGLFVASALGFALRTEPLLSRLVFLVSLPCIFTLVVLERYLCFRLELHVARRAAVRNRVLIVGTDNVAARLARALAREPRLRSRVVGFVATLSPERHPDIPAADVKGALEDLERLIPAEKVDQIVVTDSNLGYGRLVDIVLLCERNMVTFNLVPDVFRILTARMDVQTIADVPLLGIGRWPLDFFWNRLLKRVEDVAGAVFGLTLAAPVLVVAMALVRRSSPGPVFYRQERCGERGRTFVLYKLRTMREDAEAQSGPVWAVKDDPRRTRVGATLRRHNLDELPQLWNVLKGDMSLVGPRPERPHFVEQFKEDISGYMSRHVCKPGMTGWAQVNGLRGNTSIQERIKYDLYYLENWSIAFDFKILVKTLFSRENAY